ncbi:hypothetical protein [Alistipes ihumii]|uniref:hypothetical protein n=1 Tax=Alistipes ihumii TaxID=1470347 RepID=UPI00307BBA6D
MRRIVVLLMIAMLIFCNAVVNGQEGEHPPLPDRTEQAVVAYRRNPTDAAKQELFNVIKEHYDTIIQLKKDSLVESVRGRNNNIDGWMQTVLSGGVPSFMQLSTDHNKVDERNAIAEAVRAYRKNPITHNEKKVKKALNAYYDAFLKEQEDIVKDMEDSREGLIAALLERFTSDSLKLSLSAKNTVGQEDALAE